jgi:hypothetical protein
LIHSFSGLHREVYVSALCEEPCEEPCCVRPTHESRPKPDIRAASRRGWQQLALIELDDLADLYGIDLSQVRL